MARIDAFLELTVQQGGSDLHLVPGQPPRIRLHGRLETVRFRELSVADLESLLMEVMTPAQLEVLRERSAVDFAYETESFGRFRANVYEHLGGFGAVLRAIRTQAPSIEDLGLPDAVKHVLSVGKGLILVTGPTGSGKSTTLAAMVDWLNKNRSGHVLTIEDPIEYVHDFGRSVVTQREVGTHTPDFAAALRSALREDPDSVLVGEMRDLETISLALTAAETGVQVLGTLHTNGAIRAVDRVVNVFPAKRQDQVRTMLADSLKLVVAQQLVRKADGSGRQVACETLVATHAVSSMIRQGQTHKLTSAIQAGSRYGMQSLDAVLQEMLRKGEITGEEAYEHAVDRAQFERYIGSEAA